MHFLLEQNSVYGLDDTELLAFKEEYRPSAFICRSFGCAKSVMGFSSKHLLSTHESLHTQSLRCYQSGCSYNDVGFTNENSLRSHMKNRHQAPEPSPIPKRLKRHHRTSTETLTQAQAPPAGPIPKRWKRHPSMTVEALLQAQAPSPEQSRESTEDLVGTDLYKYFFDAESPRTDDYLPSFTTQPYQPPPRFEGLSTDAASTVPTTLPSLMHFNDNIRRAHPGESSSPYMNYGSNSGGEVNGDSPYELQFPSGVSRDVRYHSRRELRG